VLTVIQDDKQQPDWGTLSVPDISRNEEVYKYHMV
jgi:hypothetical protein